MKNPIDLVIPISPYNVVKPLIVAGDDKFAMDGDAEIPMDHKIQGKYGGVCELVRTHDKSDLGLESGDLVIIWDTAIAPFELPRGAGELYLIKDADLFSTIPKSDSEEFLRMLSCESGDD